MFSLHVWLCIIHIPGICRGQERVLALLGMELEMVVSHHVGTENQTLLSGQVASVLNHLYSSQNILLTKGRGKKRSAFSLDNYILSFSIRTRNLTFKEW